MEECELLAKDCEVYRAWAGEDGDDATAAALASRARTARAAAEFVADKAAARCLDHANEHQDTETGYIATSANDGAHQWCAVWANHVKNPRKKTIDFPSEVGAFAAELPKQVLSQAVAMRARLTHVDTYSELCTNELMAVKGAGILRVDLLSLPPLASSGRGWTVRPVTPLTDRIDRVPYPIPRPDDDDDAAAPTPAIRISHDLPKDLALVDPSPRVGWWDATKSEWTEAGVSDVVLDADTNRLSFSTIVLERFAVVQSRCAMFPYRAWHVRPTAGNVGDSVTISVTPASAHVTEGSPLEIEVGDGWARLANAEDLPVPRFSALRGMSNESHTLTPRELIEELSRRGVHLAPDDRDANVLDVKLKDPGLTAAACVDVGIIAPGYFVHSSRWCDDGRFGLNDVVVRVAEVRDPDLVDQLDVHKIFANEHDPAEWRPDRYDWGMRCLLRNERGCAVVDAKDSYDDLDASIDVVVKDGRGDSVGAKAVRSRREGFDPWVPAPVYYPDSRAMLRETSSKGGRERIDDAAATATAATAETLRLLGVFSFTREPTPQPTPEPTPEPELEPEPEPEVEPEPEPELDEDGNPVEKPAEEEGAAVVEAGAEVETGEETTT
jgi:cancer susceptibility candidate protein 1